MLWIAGYGSFLNQVQTIQPQSYDQNTDAIIVLTGGNYRIATGLQLFAEQKSNQLFITGVHPTVKEQQIRRMWDGKTPPLGDCCITLGHKATTTIGNAIETQEWITEHEIKSIRLVTSTYHMPRASLEFNYKLRDTEIIQHPVDVKDYEMKDLKFWSLTFQEYNKVLYRTGIIQLKNRRLLP